MSKKELNELSAKDLEKLLVQKKREEKAARLEKKQAYETERDKLVWPLVEAAKRLHGQMSAFKSDAMSSMEGFRETAKEYGDIKSNSKGGFTLRTKDGKYKIALERNIKSEYDERADQAEQLLKDFLADKVKKRDLKAYKAIEALLTRNHKTGKFNPIAINSLLSIEDNYDDERWNKAMQLFKESYRILDVSMNISFYEKDKMGRDIMIPLTFASINNSIPSAG